jgi:hypothetical protein
MQNYKIPRSEILKLYESSLDEISTHSINQWLKVVTNNEFCVLPNMLFINFIEAIEQSNNLNLYDALNERWNFEEIKEILK